MSFLFFILFFDKVVKLVGGGSVINGAYRQMYPGANHHQMEPLNKYQYTLAITNVSTNHQLILESPKVSIKK